MNSLAAIIPALALAFPMAVAELPGSSLFEADSASETAAAASTSSTEGSAPEPFKTLDQARKAPVENQVRIEQRVIIRIAPSSPRTVTQSMSRFSDNVEQFEEERIGDCIPINAIAAVQPADDSRLILFTRDRRVLSAALEKSCNPDDFYLGFYVERSSDGQLCARRDKLQSRAGASCRFTRLSRLVADHD